jgi:hypothetical protein
MKRRIYGFGVVQVVANVCQDVTIDFRPLGVDLGARWRIVRTGWAPAFDTLDGGVATVAESTVYPPSQGGDWRAVYRLQVGAAKTETLVIPWHYPLEREDDLPPDWDGQVTVACGGGETSPWGFQGGGQVPVVWLDIRRLRVRELDELQEETCAPRQG